MIISHIIGGLGNQMFQYASARALAIDLGVELAIDVSDFDGYSLHQGFEIQRVFNCSAAIAANADLEEILGWQKSKLVRKVLKRYPFSLLRSQHLVVEPSFTYWPGIWKVLDNSYLMGYWQSEKYFAHRAPEIRKEFSFVPELVGRNAEVADLIRSTNAVSMHIRRGDYVSNARTQATHGLCSIDYYNRAVETISDRLKRPVFFVFSDDIAWAKENLQIDFPCLYVDHNNNKDSFNDMRLMSLCKHNIIANSSFSWWGAWLNSNPEKVVIAPDKWFANGESSADLIPNEWIRL